MMGSALKQGEEFNTKPYLASSIWVKFIAAASHRNHRITSFK
jgi:hypothetical protein